jgi:hypothetical protein
MPIILVTQEVVIRRIETQAMAEYSGKPLSF